MSKSSNQNNKSLDRRWRIRRYYKVQNLIVTDAAELMVVYSS